MASALAIRPQDRVFILTDEQLRGIDEQNESQPANSRRYYRTRNLVATALHLRNAIDAALTHLEQRDGQEDNDLRELLITALEGGDA